MKIFKNQKADKKNISAQKDLASDDDFHNT
jgi:hypothetical protein